MTNPMENPHQWQKRTQRVVNYQELYDYHTGQVKATKDTKKDIQEATPVPSTPSATRIATHAVSKDPNALKGATPKQTIPVLVLRPTNAKDSDDTVIYEDEDITQPEPNVPGETMDTDKDRDTGTQGGKPKH